MRIVAFKHPDWTGRIAVVVHSNDGGVTFVRIDGVWHGGQVTGRVVDQPRQRWYFHGPTSRAGFPSLPEWVHLLPKNVVVVRPPRSRSKCDECGCVLARYLGEPETHEPDCPNFPL